MFALGIVLFLIVVFVVIGAWQRKVDREEKEKALSQLRDAQERGTHKPITQYPQINPFSCIGCGSCIEACPEDEVIGLINGIAHIVNGSRCVGHAQCEFACPVGAIKVGLGNAALRPDIPVLSAQMETSIPAVFIAGELGGISLIRNAIAQGSQVIHTIAERLRQQRWPAQPGLHDVVIVGAGPAGLAASLKAVEHRLNYITISQDGAGGTVRKYPRRKLTLVQPVVLPLYGRMKGGEYEKEALVRLWEELIKTYNLTVRTGVGLLDIHKKGDVLEVMTTAGTMRTRSVVLAMGRRGIPRKLGVPGEEAAKVMYQLIDTTTYSKQRLLVVGGGDSAVEAATGLANQVSNQISIAYRQKNFFRLKARNEKRIQEYIAQGRLRAYFSAEVQAISSQDVRLTVEEGGSKKSVVIPNDYVFIFAGGDPPYPLLKKIGIRFGGEPAKTAA